MCWICAAGKKGLVGIFNTYHLSFLSISAKRSKLSIEASSFSIFKKVAEWTKFLLLHLIITESLHIDELIFDELIIAINIIASILNSNLTERLISSYKDMYNWSRSLVEYLLRLKYFSTFGFISVIPTSYMREGIRA